MNRGPKEAPVLAAKSMGVDDRGHVSVLGNSLCIRKEMDTAVHSVALDCAILTWKLDKRIHDSLASE